MCGSFCEPRSQTEFRDLSFLSSPDGRRGVGRWPHALCARSFGIRIRLKAAQLNTNNHSTFARPRSFTFLKGPICFSQPNGFSTYQRLLRLTEYPGCRLVRSSIAPFCRRATCGVTPNSRTVLTKSRVS